MTPHQQHVIDEQIELADKLGKLNKVLDSELFKGLAQEEKDRLRMQAIWMKGYNDVLLARIEAFS